MPKFRVSYIQRSSIIVEALDAEEAMMAAEAYLVNGEAEDVMEVGEDDGAQEWEEEISSREVLQT